MIAATATFIPPLEAVTRNFEPEPPFSPSSLSSSPSSCRGFLFCVGFFSPHSEAKTVSFVKRRKGRIGGNCSIESYYFWHIHFAKQVLEYRRCAIIIFHRLYLVSKSDYALSHFHFLHNDFNNPSGRCICV